VFAEHNEIVVAWVGQHTDQENPHVDGATDQKLVDRINALRPPRR
jgi:hypothetical protein